MSAYGDFADIAPFDVEPVAVQTVPFVFNSPHSGRFYPQRFLDMSRLDRQTIRRSEDAYVDELFAGVAELGAPFLRANFPRAYLDVNREPWELDPRMYSETLPAFANTRSARVAGGLGTVPKIVGEGLDIYPSRLPLSEAVARIEIAYKPYHAHLRELLAETRARFGFAVLIDCHSMPTGISVGENGMRPDFIVGDRFGTSASRSLSAIVIGLLGEMGYLVGHNKPYAGGFITEHYGKPGRNLHAIQLEINRGLYMNETSYDKSAGFDLLRNDILEFCRKMIDAQGGGASGLPLAAE